MVTGSVKITAPRSLLGVLLATFCVFQPYAPRAVAFGGDDAQETALFDELHVHSRNSFDAGRANTSFGPDMAYKYARGEAIIFSLDLLTKQERFILK